MMRSKKSILFYAVPLLIALHSVSAQTFPLRINSGSNVTVQGWEADQFFGSGYFDTGNRCTNGQAIQYCKMRSFSVAGYRGYNIPVPNGGYNVVLHFMENYWNDANKRSFDIVIEGTIVAPSFDIAAEAPGKNVPVSVTFPTTVADGVLNIELSKVLGNPIISGLEILNAVQAGPTKSPVQTAAPVGAPPTAPAPVAPPPTPITSPTNMPPLSQGAWIQVNANANISARHEACFVMVTNPIVGKRAYLVGGRGSKVTNIYNPYTRQWTVGATPPIELHHMQCVEAQGLLWIVSAWTGGYPNEVNAGFIYVYDPASNLWSTRTAMPVNRRRGAAAVVVVGNKIYVSHGNYGGHEEAGGEDTATSVGWIDYYDIGTDSWTALVNDAPNPRDHTGGALIGNSICVAGGRDGGTCTTSSCWPSVEQTDCYDLTTGTWSVKPSIPQKRAGASYGTTCDGKLMVAGGEGEGQAWNQVNVFDGNTWETIKSLNVQRHGSGLAVDCECLQVHIASGATAQGGGPETQSVETFFYSGIDTLCNGPPTSAPIPNSPTSTFPTAAPIKVPVPLPTFSPTAPPKVFNDILINAGGPKYTETGGSGRTWQADTNFAGGKIYSKSGIAILNTTEDALYSSERWGTFSYNIPVPPASYKVVLHFAEIWHTSPGLRSFNINVEGVTSGNVDIAAMTGVLTAMTLEYVVSVQDGILNIKFAEVVPKKDNPKVNAIEVTLSGSFPSPPSAPAPTAPSPTPPAPVPPTPPPMMVTAAPVPVPTPAAPVPVPTPAAPVPVPTPAPTTFNDILINVGGNSYTEIGGAGRTWQADMYGSGGGTYNDGKNDILDTIEDTLYHSERYGTFSYEIPVPTANYEVNLHFCEIYWTAVNNRMFNVEVEGKKRENVDIVKLAGPLRAMTLTFAVTVQDGGLSIKLSESDPKVDFPKLSAIEVKVVGPHLAHAVTVGPYVAVDETNSGKALVTVDGGPSHTHGQGLFLTSWAWKEGQTILATTAAATFELDVGEHTVALEVTDNENNQSIEQTTISVYEYGHPVIKLLTPDSGSIAGGYSCTITGIGFIYSAAETIVVFGVTSLTGSQITIVNSKTINFVVPATAIGAPAQVVVTTPKGTSLPVLFDYEGPMEIKFTSSKLFSLGSPSVGAFGPDGRLYVGTSDGKLAKYTLNADYTAPVDSVVATIAPYRAVMGIAFDPMDPDPENPAIYVSHNFFFHKDSSTSSGKSINGVISRVTGANLETVTDIITGLPVSDHDHGVNGLEFGDNGELYIVCGGNTNGGIPGQLSGSQIQKESYYSGAVLKADMGKVGFNGFITYTNDVPNPNDVSVFAPGLRNPYGIAFHSNGKLYATDNGPNVGYGDMATGCGEGEQINDVFEHDKVIHVQAGKYYGHPNPTRAQIDSDPRQCVWRSQKLPSSADHEAPILKVASSTNGIIEFATNHFVGQMRGNLIVSKYQQYLFRIILNKDGTGVIPESKPAPQLVGNGGLGVTQAPDGTLVEIRYQFNEVYAHKPDEAPYATVSILSVFPRRGGVAGGQKVKIYGKNFASGSTVTFGGKNCPVLTQSSTLITCTVPGGPVGSVDVVVTGGGNSLAFTKSYRYITGVPF